MPARNLPYYHHRRHSWPPFSTRGLLSVAPVHFHLNPNPKKRSATDMMPSSSSSSRQSQQQQQQQQLPDIDDDPFAHFLSPVTDDDINPFLVDDDANLTFSAGIIIAEKAGDDEKKERLKHKLARRWAKYVAKYHHTGSGSSNRRAVRAAGNKLESVEEEEQQDVSEGSAMAVDEGYMSEDYEATGGAVLERKPSRRPGPEPLAPYKTVVREPTKGHAQDLVEGRMRKRRKYRHSWRAPDQDLFTVVEEGEGATAAAASEIEQRYFSV